MEKLVLTYKCDFLAGECGSFTASNESNPMIYTCTDDYCKLDYMNTDKERQWRRPSELDTTQR